VGIARNRSLSVQGFVPVAQSPRFFTSMHGKVVCDDGLHFTNDYKTDCDDGLPFTEGC
jgi:hypothetical protein